MKTIPTPLSLETLPAALELEKTLNELLRKDEEEHITAGGDAYLTGPDGGPLSAESAEELLRAGEQVFFHLQINHWHHGRNGKRGDSGFEDHRATFAFFNNLNSEEIGAGSGDGYETISYNIVPMSRTRLKKLTEELIRELIARDEYPEPNPTSVEKVAELEKELPQGIVWDCRRASRDRIENRKHLRCMTSTVQKEEDFEYLREEDSVR